MRVLSTACARSWKECFISANEQRTENRSFRSEFFRFSIRTIRASNARGFSSRRRGAEFGNRWALFKGAPPTPVTLTYLSVRGHGARRFFDSAPGVSQPADGLQAARYSAPSELQSSGARRECDRKRKRASDRCDPSARCARTTDDTSREEESKVARIGWI